MSGIVRYHGLGTYEGMRREALMGLQDMEQSGQIESLTTKLDSTKMELKEMDDKVVAAKVSWDNTEVDLRSQLAEMASAKMDSIEEVSVFR